MANLISTRDAYGKALSRLGISYPNLVVLDAGRSEATRTVYFAREFPERFFQVGVSEQDLINTAAGLALAGKIAFASTYAMFGTRAWEQIRNTLARDNIPVRLCFTHAGFAAAEDGGGLQCLEDIAIFRVLPNMAVFVPCDAVETEMLIEYLAENRKGPAYVRLGRSEVPVITDGDAPFIPGKAKVLREGNDIAIAACGIMVSRALEAADMLAKNAIKARVLNVSCIKPLDREAILSAASETKGIITAEEHSVIGGLGSAVAELVSHHHPAPVYRVGVEDRFGELGSPDELLARHGLTADGIAERAKNLIAKSS